MSSITPTSYTPGQKLTVGIAVVPDAQTSAWAAEDAPPLGWTVSEIDASGTFDETNGKVKWGPFFESQARTLSYTLTSPVDAVGTHAFAGQASFDGTNVAISGMRSVSAALSGYPFSYWIPVASHAAGARNSQWRTDLGILNVGASQAAFEVHFYGSGGPRVSSSYVPPATQSILTDVVGQVGGVGSGALEVRSDRELAVSSRTYNLVAPSEACYAGGTLGQDYPAYSSGGGLSANESAWLVQLQENTSYRTNIGVTNTGPTTATVRIELFDGAGLKLLEYSLSLAAGQWKQENQPYKLKAGKADLTRAYARVTVVSGSGIVAYASVVDNVTNDPTTIAMVR